MQSETAVIDKEAKKRMMLRRILEHKAGKAKPWYDSIWLRQYLVAKWLIQECCPERLDEFVQAMAPLRTDPGFKEGKVTGLFDDVMDEIRAEVAALPETGHKEYEIERFGRRIVHNRPYFTALQHKLVDRVSELAGEEVEPGYNFLSLYTKMGVCEPHIDAPSAKWTVDLCIDQSDVWPIHFSQIVPWPEDVEVTSDTWEEDIKSDQSLRFTGYELQPGEALFFSGRDWGFESSRVRQ